MAKRELLFLRNVLFFTFTTFGGAQAHLSLLMRYFVKETKFVSEEELLELNALSQILPGPASTQTVVGIGFKVGGYKLAIISFLIWIFPSAAIMTLAAIWYGLLKEKDELLAAMRFVHPIAIGIVAYGAYNLGKKVLDTQIAVFLAFGALVATLIVQEAYVFPMAILIGGIVSSAIATPSEETAIRVGLFANINRKKLAYFLGVLLFMAMLGAIINRSSPFSLPIRLFENFYRNGIFIFGGGQVLVPMMFTEFVQMKEYLSQADFISGFAFQQVLPGPTFSFTSYIGALGMKHADYGVFGQIAGGALAVLGINLPGLILILFIVPFWEDLKKISQIKYSLSGINAVSIGFIVAAFMMLLVPVGLNFLFLGIVLATFFILNFTKISPAIVILVGLIVGYIL